MVSFDGDAASIDSDDEGSVMSRATTFQTKRTSCCFQCSILTHKHWLERKRQISQQILHVVFPVAAVLSLLALQGVADNLYRPGVAYSPVQLTTEYHSICDDVLEGNSADCVALVYSPSGVSWVNDVMHWTFESFEGLDSPVSQLLTPLPRQADTSSQAWCTSGPGTTDYECPGRNCTQRFPACNTTFVSTFPSPNCFAAVLQEGELLMPCAFFQDNLTMSDMLLSGTTVQNAVLFTGAYIQAAIPDELEAVTAGIGASLKEQFWNYNLYYNSSRNTFPQYKDDYALTLKNALDTAVLRHRLGWSKNSTAQIELNASYFAFPEPPATLEKFDVIAEFGALWFFLPGLSLFYMVLVSIVSEKENNFRVGLQMMGMRTSVFWGTWLLIGSLFAVVSGVALVLTARAAQVTVFQHADWPVFLTLYICYGYSMVGFAIGLSSCIKTVRIAQALAWVVILVGFIFQATLTIANSSLLQIVYLSVLPDWLEDDPRGAAAMLSTTIIRNILWLYPPFHVAKGYHDVASFAAYSFDFVSQQYSPPENYSLSQMLDTHNVTLLSGYDYVATLPPLLLTLGVLVISGTGYALLGLAVDIVQDQSIAAAAGATSQRARKCILCCGARSHSHLDDETRSCAEGISSDDGRSSLPKRSAVVSLSNLGKRYPNSGGCTSKQNPWALRGLTLSCYRDEILCLLGHNGAGKSTTLLLLVGLMAPTEGSVAIHATSADAGVDTDSEDDDNNNPLHLNSGNANDRISQSASRRSNGVHRSLLVGVCPQYDLLWPSLSAEEHLTMFARLKGVPPHAIKSEVDRKLRLVDLHSPTSREKRAAAMSGGMRRRLSVAVSVIGEPPVVVLDEPTTGIDPFHQMELWQAIDRLKANRTILLTTHNMEEAETLASRVAVLQGGKLLHTGTALGLKNRLSSAIRVSGSSFAEPDSIEAWANSVSIRYTQQICTTNSEDGLRRELEGPSVCTIAAPDGSAATLGSSRRAKTNVAFTLRDTHPLKGLAWLVPEFQAAQASGLVLEWKLEQLGSLQTYMNPQFNKAVPSLGSEGEPADESSTQLLPDSQLELSRAAMLEKAAVSFLAVCPAALAAHSTLVDATTLRSRSIDAGVVCNPLRSICRRACAAVYGAVTPTDEIDTYGCLWCSRLGALVRKKIALQSRQWCQNMCLVLTCAMTVVVLIVFNSVISDQISLVGGASSSTDSASLTVIVPSLPSLLLLNELALQPSAYVYGNMLFSQSTDNNPSFFSDQDQNTEATHWGDCAILFEVRSAVDNVSSLFDKFPSTLCTFVNSTLENFGAQATSINELPCQAWDTNSPHDISTLFDSPPSAGKSGCQDPFDEGIPWCFVDSAEIEFEWCFSNVHLTSPIFDVTKDCSNCASVNPAIVSANPEIQSLQESLYAHVDFATLLAEFDSDVEAADKDSATFAVLRNGVPDAALHVANYKISEEEKVVHLSYSFTANTLLDPADGRYSFHRENGFYVDDPGSRSFLFVDSGVASTAMRAKVMEVIFRAVTASLLPTPPLQELAPFISLLSLSRRALRNELPPINPATWIASIAEEYRARRNDPWATSNIDSSSDTSATLSWSDRLKSLRRTLSSEIDALQAVLDADLPGVRVIQSRSAQGCLFQSLSSTRTCAAGSSLCVESEAGDVTLRYRLELQVEECAGTCGSTLNAGQVGVAYIDSGNSLCKCFVGKAPVDFTTFRFGLACSIGWPEVGLRGPEDKLYLDFSDIEVEGEYSSTAVYSLRTSTCPPAQFSADAQSAALSGQSDGTRDAEVALLKSFAAALLGVVSGDVHAVPVRQVHANGTDGATSCADACLRYKVNAEVVDADLPRFNEYTLAENFACYWNGYVADVDWFYLAKNGDGSDASFNVTACAELCLNIAGCTGFEFASDEYCSAWMNQKCSQGSELHFMAPDSGTITGFVSATVDDLATCVDEQTWVSNIGLTCRDYAALSICSYYDMGHADGWGPYNDPGWQGDGDIDFLHRDANGIPVTEACCACNILYQLQNTQLQGSELQDFESLNENGSIPDVDVYYARTDAGLWRTFPNRDFRQLTGRDLANANAESFTPSALALQDSLYPFDINVTHHSFCRQYCGFFPECMAYSFHQDAVEGIDDDYQKCYFFALVIGAERPIEYMQRPGYISAVRLQDSLDWQCNGFISLNGSFASQNFGIEYSVDAEESVCLLLSEDPTDMTLPSDRTYTTARDLFEEKFPLAHLVMQSVTDGVHDLTTRFCRQGSPHADATVDGMDGADVSSWIDELESTLAEDPTLAQFEWLVQLLSSSVISTFPFTLTPPLLAAVDLLGILIYPLLFTFQMPILAFLLVWEKQERLRRLQRGAGVSAALYYSSHYVLCMVIYIVTIATCWICGFAAEVRFFRQTAWQLLLVLALVAGNAVVACSWILAAFFHDKQAVVVVGLLIVFVGHALGIVVVAGFFGQPLALMPSLSAATVLPPALLVVPQFAIARAIYILVTYCAASFCISDPTAALYGGYGSASQSGGFGGDGPSELGACLLALALFAIVLMPFTAIVDWKCSRGQDDNDARNIRCRCFSKSKGVKHSQREGRESDFDSPVSLESDGWSSPGGTSGYFSFRGASSTRAKRTRARTLTSGALRPTTTVLEMQDVSSAPTTSDSDAPRIDENRNTPTCTPDTCALIIDNVHKVWADGKHAVQGVSLRVQYGNAYALLGVNGAGKSSLLTMIAGSTHVSSGSISVLGKEVQCARRTSVKGRSGVVPTNLRFGVTASSANERPKENCFSINQSGMGICPQHDALWGSMSAEEHLFLFARLKLYRRRTRRQTHAAQSFNQAIHDAVETALLQADLAEKNIRSRPASKLSGGMRRRLSVAMAVIGDVTLLVLDEPSTGLDPWAQLELWKMLRRWQSHSPLRRTMLLCTHDMTEAELLCDHFAILNDGVLLANGNCADLLRKFNCDTLTLHVEFCPSAANSTRNERVDEELDCVASIHAFLNELTTQFPGLVRGDRESILGLKLEQSIKVDIFKQHAKLGDFMSWLDKCIDSDQEHSLFLVKHWFLRDSGLRKIFEVAMGIQNDTYANNDFGSLGGNRVGTLGARACVGNTGSTDERRDWHDCELPADATADSTVIVSGRVHVII